jgi:hypothetical protein
MSDKVAVSPEFHDVIFTVSKVTPGAVVHEGHQVITARSVIKLDNAGVNDLMKILRAYKKEYRKGAGPVMFTLEGKFSR